MFYERLEKLCETNGLTVAAACQLAGLHRSTHIAWRNGTAPSQQSLCALIPVLHTSVSYLMSGVESEEDKPSEDVDPFVFDLLKEVGQMNSPNRTKLLNYARSLCAQQSPTM